MPFLTCIADAVRGGVLDEADAEAYRDAYADHEAAFRSGMTPHEAAAEAARATFAEIEGDVAERRRQTFLSLSARQTILQRLDSYVDYISKKPNPYRAAGGLYDRLLPNRNGLAVEQQREFWRGQAHGEMDAAFNAYRQDIWGRQGMRADEGNVVAEAFGKNTGDDEARRIAQGWTKARELLRAGFNRFGGHISEIADYGFPQVHSQRLINAEYRELFKKFRASGLDEVKAKDRATEAAYLAWRDFLDAVPGGIRLVQQNGRELRPGKRYEQALRDMYNSIVTNGWDDKETTARNPRSGALANRRAEHRFLNFNDPAGWLAYQRRFGEGNVFDTMMSHIDAMAKDIAHMEVMGPNPGSTVQWLKNELEKRAALSGESKQVRQAKSTNAYLDNLYAQYSGSANMPANQLAAEIEGDLRNVATSALLGSATLTAVPTDLNYSRMTRAFNGLPQVKGLEAYLKLLNPASEEDRMLAMRLGLTAEGYARTLHDSARVMDQVYGHEWSKWVVDRALMWNGLRSHTEAARWAYGWTAQGALAQEAKTEWGALDRKFREGLERYGIGEGEWNQIRATTPYDSRGATFIRPADIMARTDLDQSTALDLARKVSDWVLTETEFAVPSSSLAARAMSRGSIRPGSLPGTLLSSPMMFKAFALTYLLSHGRRILARSNWQERGKYAASLFVLSTFAGAIAVQMREIAQGRDPMDMNPLNDNGLKFWGKAMASGGGLGIFGDYFFNALNASKKDMASTLAGPQASFLSDLAKTALSQPVDMATTDDTRAGQSGLANNAVSFAKRWMPGGSTWYARKVMEAYVFDAIQEELDPNWRQRVSHVERWYAKNTGQQYWWHRGDQPGLDGSTVRAPDLSAMAGDQSSQ